MTMFEGVQAHSVLGHFPALHGGDRRKRQLARDVAGGIDVLDVGLTMIPNLDVAACDHVDTRRFEAQTIGIGDGPDGQHRM